VSEPGPAVGSTRPADEVVTLRWDRRRTLSRVVAGLTRRFDSMLLRRRLAAMGPGSYIERPRRVHGEEGLALGSGVLIWRDVLIEVLRIFPDRPTVSIGDGSVLRPYTHLGAVSGITFGRRVGIASGVLVTDHEHDVRDPRESILTNDRVIAAPVVIEDDVFLAERCVVLKGVRIGRCSVVGANSVVKEDVPPYSIAVGIPARVVKRYDPERRAWTKP
jgi:lipopolysaccharide O-acetyltransferase